MPYNTPCKTCNGTRSEPGSSYKTCNYCRGSGIVEKQEQRGFLFKYQGNHVLLAMVLEKFLRKNVNHVKVQEKS